MSIKFFKLKRKLTKLKDRFLRPFRTTSDRMKEIREMEKTQRVIVGFTNTGEKIYYNFKRNIRSWKDRTIDEHGFDISHKDS